jgi:hypothetical protein
MKPEVSRLLVPATTLLLAASTPQQPHAADRSQAPPASLQAAAQACLLQARTNQQALASRTGLTGPSLEMEFNLSSRVAKTLVTIAPCESRTPHNLPPYWHCPERSAKVVTCLTFARGGGIQTVLSDSRVLPARSLKDLEIESMQVIPPDTELSAEEWSLGALGYWLRAEIDPQNEFHILEWGSAWKGTRPEMH